MLKMLQNLLNCNKTTEIFQPVIPLTYLIFILQLYVYKSHILYTNIKKEKFENENKIWNEWLNKLFPLFC